MVPHNTVLSNRKDMDLAGGSSDGQGTGYDIVPRHWWSMAQCPDWMEVSSAPHGSAPGPMPCNIMTSTVGLNAPSATPLHRLD